MIRIPVNLASEPFRRSRAALVGSISAIVILVVLLLGQFVYILSRRGEAATTRTELAQLNRQLAAISREQDKLDTTLRQPQNAEVLDYSVFLNTLIERKAISWTKLFADLEKVIPYDVRIISVRLPQIDNQNHVQLDMIVGAKDPAPVVRMIKLFEASPLFGPTVLHNSSPATQNDPLVHYRVTVSYAQRL
ncbi:MAG TPA: hypothetical protein VN610_03595 [Bryobacteraceae bacterium]|nr:hypothetical protein [Bryobacteraceae bacterium]